MIAAALGAALTDRAIPVLSTRPPARTEAAGLLAALKAEVAAVAGEVIELRHQCQQASEKLVLEVGEQSLTLR